MTDNLAMVKDMEHNSVGEKERAQAAHPYEDTLPKIGLPLDFIHVSPANPSSYAAETPSIAATTTSTVKEAPSISTAHLLQEYMHYFTPHAESTPPTVASPPEVQRSSATALWWGGALIAALLLANIVTMLTQNFTSSKKNLAVIEFEHTQLPESSTPPPPPKKEQIPVEYSTPALNVPKRRVLVISEETRKELLEQLKEPDASVSPVTEERLEFYRK